MRHLRVWLGMHAGYPPIIAFSTKEAALVWLRAKGEGYQTTSVPLDRELAREMREHPITDADVEHARQIAEERGWV